MRATPGIVADRLRQFLRDRARRLAQRARELKGDRHGEIAERAGRRHFDREIRHVGQAVLAADRAGDRVVDVSLNGQNHGCVGTSGGKLPVSS